MEFDHPHKGVLTVSNDRWGVTLARWRTAKRKWKFTRGTWVNEDIRNSCVRLWTPGRCFELRLSWRFTPPPPPTIWERL